MSESCCEREKHVPTLFHLERTFREVPVSFQFICCDIFHWGVGRSRNVTAAPHIRILSISIHLQGLQIAYPFCSAQSLSSFFHKVHHVMNRSSHNYFLSSLS